MKLSPDQQQALKIACDKNFDILIITGGAGTGKSFVIDEIQKSSCVEICATTGAAAAGIGGVTIDQMVKMNRNNYTKPRGSKSWFDKHMGTLHDTIIIDEASMIGEIMMDYLLEWVILRSKKKLILVGDWAQAKPVKDGWITESEAFAISKQTDMLEEELIVKRAILEVQHRQDDDAEFLDLLTRMRVGGTNEQDNIALQARAGFRAPTAEEFIDSDNECVCLYGVNAMADRLNTEVTRELINRGAESVTLTAEIVEGEVPENVPAAEFINNSRMKNSGMAHKICIAMGSRVMITRNVPDLGVVNGDMGTVTGFNEECIEIKVERVVSGIPSVFEVSMDAVDAKFENSTDSYTISGYPIRPAYGLTVHKAQGKTLKLVFIDMQSFYPMANVGQEALHGLAYVALSRAKSLDGVFLNVWDPEMVHSSSEIKEWIR